MRSTVKYVTPACEAVYRHLQGFFVDHDVALADWNTGPARTRVRNFGVVTVGPGPKLPGRWTYVSLGCWDATQVDGHGLEFALIASSPDDIHVESLAMNAYYHAGPDEQRLDLGHTVPIGRAWSPGSDCDHYLVSLPYPFGPEFEICEWEGGHARLLWLLPITGPERDFKIENGLEALEQRFEDRELMFWDPLRKSLAQPNHRRLPRLFPALDEALSEDLERPRPFEPGVRNRRLVVVGPDGQAAFATVVDLITSLLGSLGQVTRQGRPSEAIPLVAHKVSSSRSQTDPPSAYTRCWSCGDVVPSRSSSG